MTLEQSENTYKILSKYVNHKPMAAEKCYPVSAVEKMMIDYHELVSKPTTNTEP